MTRHAAAIRRVVGGIWALYWWIGPSPGNERNEFTRTVAQLLGGAALLASLYFTYRNLQVTRLAT